MVQLTRGFRCKLEDHFDLSKPVSIVIKTFGNAVYDTCCMEIDMNGKMADDSYVVFENQRKSPDDSVVYKGNDCFSVDFSKTAGNIGKYIFAVCIDGSETMDQIASHTVTLSQDGTDIMNLEFSGNDFNGERAVVSIELYLKTVWRLGVTAGGYKGGFDEMMKEYSAGESADTVQISNELSVPEIFGDTAEQPEPEEIHAISESQQEPEETPAISESQPEPEETPAISESQPEPEETPAISESQPEPEETSAISESQPESEEIPATAENHSEQAAISEITDEQTEEDALTEINESIFESENLSEYKTEEADSCIQETADKSVPLPDTAVILEKGNEFDINPADKVIFADITWKLPEGVVHIECDGSAIFLTGGKLANSRDIVCFTNSQHISGSAEHIRCGSSGALQCERIKIKLCDVPDNYDSILPALNLYMPKILGHHAGELLDLSVSLSDENENIICVYHLSNDRNNKTAVITGAIVRKGDYWCFRASELVSDDCSINELSRKLK